MIKMTDSRETILNLKQIRAERGLSQNDIIKMCEEKGYYISKTTVSRLFAEGSEDIKFRYEDTIRPIANVLLDIDTIEETDTNELQAMKSLLKFKDEMIVKLEEENKELMAVIDKEKVKCHEKLDKEREQSRRSIEFLKEQLAYKDRRMDEFMESVKDKDRQLSGLLDHILNCPYKKGGC